MTSLACRLARPEILELPPVNVIAGDSSDYAGDIVRLHLNENCYSPLVQGSESQSCNRYAEPRAPALRGAMARLYGVEPQNLIATRGADDAIDILIRTFCRSGTDAIAVSDPSFGAYGLFARIQGARVLKCPLGADFEFEPSTFVQAAEREPHLKLAFLCSPNNPTGNLISCEHVLSVADALAETIIVLDEAYIEFADAKSLAAEAMARDNLVVLRTLSKAYGLAGARVGCAIGNAELIEFISRALPPFPLASPSIAVALATLSPSRRLIHRERIARIKAERTRVAAKLKDSPLVERVWPSQTNFVLVEVTDPFEVRREIERSGIRVRWRPEIGEAVLRLSIGTQEENELALAIFGVAERPKHSRRAEIVRDTRETRVAALIDLDRILPRRIRSGVPFFDHMLDQVAAHGGFSLVLGCEGDLEIDPHHSLEDCALAFGAALSNALADRGGIGRFGFALPMDEAEAQVLIDLSGRAYSSFEGSFAAAHIGDYPTEMTRHVFRSIADALGASIQVRVGGENDHHKTEACFKAFGRALRQAIAREGEGVPSTKGMLA